MWTNEAIRVSGIPAFRGEARELHIDGLATKSLCAKHNSALSELDTVGWDVVNAFRKLAELRDRRGLDPGACTPYTLRVDGIGFERLLFKMLINVACVHKSDFRDWDPDGNVVAHVFGVSSLPIGRGLAVLPRVGDRMENAEQTSCGFLWRNGEATPSLGCVSLRGGYQFFVSWLFDWADRLRIGIADDMRDVLPRPTRYEFNYGSTALNLALEFDWSGSYQADPKLAKLRERYPQPPR